MSPAAARTAARRLVGTVLALTTTSPLAAAAGTVALDGLTGPAWWAAPLLAAFAASVVAGCVAAVRATAPDPPATALVVVGAVTAVSHSLLVRAGAADPAPSSLHGSWPIFVTAAATVAAAVRLRRAPRALGLAGSTAFCALLAAATPVPPPDFSGPGAHLAWGATLALLAAAVLSLARGLEQVTDRIGNARGAVLRANAEAEAMALAEAERGRWEAAVHDDVLSALRAGAAARTPQEVRAAAGAAKAALASIATEPATLTVGTALAAQQVAAGARSAFEDVRVELTSGTGDLPGRVVESLADAAAELMRNTVHHNSPGVRAWVRGHLDGDAARVVVVDDGRGFDPDLLPAGRLGIRVSVVGRMRSVGGDARVSSSPRGTRVELLWPR